MERYMVMRILLGLFLLFVVIFFVIRLAGGGNDTPTEEPTQIEQVVDAGPVVLGEQNNTGSVVQYTIVGKTVASEDHREIRFTISQNRRIVEIISGYDGKVIDSMQLGNTANSYQQFLYAIEEEGYSTPKKEPTVTDRTGVCSNARQYLYQVKVNGELRNDLWSVSCTKRKGTFGGDAKDIRKLVESQFPDYKDFARGIDI